MSCARTQSGSGFVCGRPATTTVGTVSLPSLAALTAAAPAGSRQMSTQCNWWALLPRRTRRRRQYVQPGRQKTTGRPSTALRRCASDALMPRGKTSGEFTPASSKNPAKKAAASPGLPREPARSRQPSRRPRAALARSTHASCCRSLSVSRKRARPGCHAWGFAVRRHPAERLPPARTTRKSPPTHRSDSAAGSGYFLTGPSHGRCAEDLRNRPLPSLKRPFFGH